MHLVRRNGKILSGWNCAIAPAEHAQGTRPAYRYELATRLGSVLLAGEDRCKSISTK